MLLDTFWKENFSTNKFYLTHEDPTIFITCQWQKNKTKPNLLYFLYRTIVMLIFFATWIRTMVGAEKYSIFLTNWAYTVCTIQALIAFTMLLTSVLSTYFKIFEAIQRVTIKMYSVYWITNSVTTSAAFAITTIYWSVLYKGNKPAFIWNYFIHGNNSILMFLDLCMVAHPIRIAHVVYTIVIGITYVFFTLIYYEAGGTGLNGKTYIYPFVDWSNPGPTTGVCIGVIVLLIVLHVLIALISFVRRNIAEKYCGKQFDVSKTETRRQTSYVNEAMSTNVV